MEARDVIWLSVQLRQLRKRVAELEKGMGLRELEQTKADGARAKKLVLVELLPEEKEGARAEELPTMRAGAPSFVPLRYLQGGTLWEELKQEQANRKGDEEADASDAPHQLDSCAFSATSPSSAASSSSPTGPADEAVAASTPGLWFQLPSVGTWLLSTPPRSSSTALAAPQESAEEKLEQKAKEELKQKAKEEIEHTAKAELELQVKEEPTDCEEEETDEEEDEETSGLLQNLREAGQELNFYRMAVLVTESARPEMWELLDSSLREVIGLHDSQVQHTLASIRDQRREMEAVKLRLTAQRDSAARQVSSSRAHAQALREAEKLMAEVLRLEAGLKDKNQHVARCLRQVQLLRSMASHLQDLEKMKSLQLEWLSLSPSVSSSSSSCS